MRLTQRAIYIAILTLFLFSSLAHAVQIEKGPYLIYEGNTAKMTVLWQLDVTGTCVLEWGTDTTYADGTVQTGEYGGDHQHKYSISGLSTATKYYYRVEVGGTWHTGSFRSAPDATAQNVKLLAYGDTRSYPSDHNTVAGQMLNAYTNTPGYQTLALHVGDFINSGDQEIDWQDEFFPRTQPNILQMQSELPIMGCKGNHEGTGTLYEKYFPYPYESGGFYWSYDYGPAHVVVIDQYVGYSSGSTQITWLENDLAATTKKWIFLVFHEPAWSAGGHSNDTQAQNVIQPLCEQYGVDVIFAGHNHYYARAVVQGVHHVTAGGGGAPLYSPNSNAQNVVASSMSHHHCEIDIQGNQLDFVARNSSGSVIDSFSLTAGGGTSTITADFSFTKNDLAVTFSDESTASNTTITDWAWDFGDGNTSTQQNPSHTYASAGTYSVQLTASDSGTTTDSVTKSVTVSTGGISYCASSGNSTQYEWVAGVQVGTLNETSGAAGYTDNTHLTANLVAGENVGVSLTPGFSGDSYTEYWMLYIDYNKNGVFTDSGEQVLNKSGNSAVSGSFTVPAGASGTTRMRVVMRYETAPSSCGTYDYGETEDYTVDITAGTVNPPVAAFTADTTSVSTGGSVSFTDQSSNGPTSWSWTFAGGTPASSSAQNPTVTYNTAGTYSVTLTATNSAGSDPETKTNYITVTDTPITYCDSTSTNNNYEWIAKVEVGNVNNSSNASGYTDFTNKVVNTSAGATVNLTLTPGFAGSSYSEYWVIWVDWNGDGDFADTGEEVYGGSGSSAVSSSFTVPSSAGGTTRMRVSMQYDSAPSSCGSFTYGEVEDYTITVQ